MCLIYKIKKKKELILKKQSEAVVYQSEQAHSEFSCLVPDMTKAVEIFRLGLFSKDVRFSFHPRGALSGEGQTQPLLLNVKLATIRKKMTYVLRLKSFRNFNHSCRFSDIPTNHSK